MILFKKLFELFKTLAARVVFLSFRRQEES